MEVIKQASKEMVDIAKRETYQNIEEQYRPTEFEVQQSAQNLINEASRLKGKYQGSVLEQIAAVQTNNETSVLNFSKKYIQNESDYSKLMEKVFDFQNKVNKFLGQKIIMTFVSITPATGQVTLYNMQNSVEDLIIERAAPSKGGNFIGRFSSIEKIKLSGQLMINSSYEKNKKETLDRTFQEVWQRYRISKSKLQLRGAAYILWNLGHWDGVWISGAGPLGEAYMAFFINKFIFSNKIESSVMTFMLHHRYGAILADTVSGFLKGDVERGAAQFGVKIKQAQPLSYIEIIKYAEEILKATNTKDFLEKLQKKLADEGIPNMVKQLTELNTTEYESLYTDLEKRISKSGKIFNKPIEIFR